MYCCQVISTDERADAGASIAPARAPCSRISQDEYRKTIFVDLYRALESAKKSLSGYLLVSRTELMHWCRDLLSKSRHFSDKSDYFDKIKGNIRQAAAKSRC